MYIRCPACPDNGAPPAVAAEECAAGSYRHPGAKGCPQDKEGRRFPWDEGLVGLEADLVPREQLVTWLRSKPDYYCFRGHQVLHQCHAILQPPFPTWAIEPRFTGCLRCQLESLGVSPDESKATFESFMVDPPLLQQHLDTCRAFASDPKGVLLMLGSCGTGKTHLAIAILRERLRMGADDVKFVKHRHFLAEHGKAMRPVPFDLKPLVSPLATCQEASMLVYDELGPATDGRSYEDLLLDLFDCRIGNFRPSVITTNANCAGLEAALGTRLFDRLRGASFAVLEFGFESKRSSLNLDYLNRTSRP